MFGGLCVSLSQNDTNLSPGISDHPVWYYLGLQISEKPMQAVRYLEFMEYLHNIGYPCIWFDAF